MFEEIGQYGGWAGLLFGLFSLIFTYLRESSTKRMEKQTVELKILSDNNNSVMKEMQKVIEGERKMREDLQRQLDGYRNELDTLRSKIIELQAENEKLHIENNELRAEIEKLKSRK